MNIQATRGDTAIFDVTVTRFNPVTEEDEIVNLTGAKAWFTVKRNRNDVDANAVVQRNSELNPSEVLITPVQGLIQVTLLPADTQDLKDRWLRYDVQVKEASGVVTTVASGRLELIHDATIVQT